MVDNNSHPIAIPDVLPTARPLALPRHTILALVRDVPLIRVIKSYTELAICSVVMRNTTRLSPASEVAT